MEKRLLNLQIVLSELGVDTGIETIDQRVTLQKAIYLAQAAGVPLRYRYNWYVMGPYSPDLTRDYYALHEQPQEDLETGRSMALREPFASTIERLSPAMGVPSDVQLNQSEWLELLASVHYLRKRSAFDAEETQARLDTLKPHVSRHTRQAEAVLSALGLMSEQK